jgi:hypothetical protein
MISIACGSWPSSGETNAHRFLRRSVAMETDDDPMARVRDRRYRAMVDELLPKVRQLNPHWSDDEVLEMAESMAELRLLDEEIG